MGGGLKVKNYSVILGGGIHLVDLLIWFVNSPIVEVYAMGNEKYVLKKHHLITMIWLYLLSNLKMVL